MRTRLAHYVALLLGLALFIPTSAHAGDVYDPEWDYDYDEPADAGEATQVAAEVLACPSSDPMVIGYASGSTYRVVRYSDTGDPIDEFVETFPNGEIVTCIAMGGDTLLAVGNSVGEVKLYEKEGGTWVFRFRNYFTNVTPMPVITAVGFGGTNYVAMTTDQGDFNVYRRPSGWDRTTPWPEVLGREFTTPVAIDAVAMSDRGWLLLGTRGGTVMLWEPDGTEYKQTFSYTLDNTSAAISAVALEDDYLAFGTNYGSILRYVRGDNDEYTLNLNRNYADYTGISAMALAPSGTLAIGNMKGAAELFTGEDNAETASSQQISDDNGQVYIVMFVDGETRLFWRSLKNFSEWYLQDKVWEHKVYE